ncbi:MAG: T9SS type A sorting domain-containing protein, partial [Candidatus Coatesbacteria bacterium]
DHTYDVLKYDMEVDVDTSGETLDCNCVVKLEFTENGVTEIGLQLHENMTLSNVRIKSGPTLAYTHTDDVVDITLDKTYNSGDVVQLEFDYSGHPSEGVYFQSNGVVHSVSWPDYAYYWFPCYDHPGDKADEGCEIEINVPVGWGAAMVGRKLTTYRYRFFDPICTYNIAWNTKDDYEVYTQTSLTPGCPYLKYTLYPEDMGDAPTAFANMPEAVDFFADTYGDWPYEDTKFGMAACPLGGGMEHPTCISIGHNYIPGSTAYEWLYVHEAAHMWFGDSVGLADWRDFWLSEGFATYSDALWKEEHYGQEDFHDRMESFKTAYFSEDVTNRFPMYDPEVMLSATVYEKGAWVLHMLRHLYDTDADFFAMVEDYYATYAHSTTITDDLQAKAESHYGSSLDWFFDEWVYMAGYPEYEYDWAETRAGGRTAVNLNLHQVQELDDETPVFEMPIDFLVTTTDGEDLITVWNDQQNQTFDVSLAVGGAITDVELDPGFWLLCKAKNTTDIEVTSFEAGSVHTGIELTWDCDDETAVGFNLYRSAAGETAAPRKKLNSSTVIGESPYSYLDAGVSEGVTYSYWLEALDAGGSTETLGPVECIWNEALPTTYALYQSRPNPARGTATIAFDLPEVAAVTLTVYDVAGRKVSTVVNETLAAGEHERTISGLAPGVYVYKMEAGSYEAMKKMVVQ